MSKVDFNPKPWSGSDEMGLSNEVNKIKGVPQTPSIAQNATTGMQTVTTEVINSIPIALIAFIR